MLIKNGPQKQERSMESDIKFKERPSGASYDSLDGRSRCAEWPNTPHGGREGKDHRNALVS